MAQGRLRYRCFLPDLTGFTVPPCTGPNYQQSTSRAARLRGELSTQHVYSNSTIIQSKNQPNKTSSACRRDVQIYATRGVMHRNFEPGTRNSKAVAEREGFEPSVPLLGVHTISSRAPSTARSPLRYVISRTCRVHPALLFNNVSKRFLDASRGWFSRNLPREKTNCQVERS